MTIVEFFTLVGSGVSAVFAYCSWRASHRVDTRMLSIEEKRERDRLVEQNTGKVRIVAVRDSKLLLIYNEGPIDISITDIILNGISIRQHPCFDFTLKDIKIPSGNSFYPLEMKTTSQKDNIFLPPYDAVVKWITKNKEEQQAEMTINWV